MEKIKKIIHEFNYLKKEDFIEIPIFVISIIPAIIFKIFTKIAKKQIWLICEDKNEARDNGYCFFKYLREKQKHVNTYYAISYKSKDFEKVKSLGKTVRYGGFYHWILYFGCKYNISSQKAGKPDAAICYVLEQLKIIKNKSVFLQHGITINKATWLFYPNTKMRLFICGAKPEYEYVKKYFEYPEENVAYTGFCRFDDYFNINVNRKQILLIPSWREWIASKNEYSKVYEDSSEFTNTEYYKKYQELINSQRLVNFLEKNDLILYFYPHRNMQKYINDFSTSCNRIKIVTNKDTDIRKLLTESAVMITDYSSVALDFAYMKKPVIYYQFDEKKFREAQYAEGYYSYRNSGLGTVTETCEQTLNELENLYSNNLVMTQEFEEKHNSFFELWDNNNCERVYNVIKNIGTRLKH
ncbi:MAG: CDP-glycerol glycerophosphotransferase family protein [Clostridia bacterium]|nr:CDP-glycerol glycerophosphotransferase family protein [Clostridia bacterium]